MGRLPEASDIFITDAQGRFATTIRDFSDLLKPLITPAISTAPVTLTTPAYTEPVKPMITPAYLEKIAPMITPAYRDKLIIYLPTPTYDINNVIKNAHVLVAAAEAMTKAQDEAIENVPQISTIPMDWDRILEQTQANRQGTIDKTFDDINTELAKGKVTPEAADVYSNAYQDYLLQKAALDAAKQTFVASISPQPIVGKISDDAVSAVAGIFLARQITENTINEALRIGKISPEVTTEQATQTITDAYSELQNLVDAGVLTNSQAAAR